MDDLDVVADGIERSTAELVDAAEAQAEPAAEATAG
jgi:hypothetical protein